MLAGPDSTIETMIEALSDTVHALDAASDLDKDRSDDDRAFFAAQRDTLTPLRTGLIAAYRALEDHDWGPRSRLQVRVELGDIVLDRGVMRGNATAKVELKGKPGLDATHVFGQQVTSLTQEKVALEPAKVLTAVGRLTDLPDFPSRTTIADDLTARAQQQQICLDEREAGTGVRDKLQSTGIKLVVDAAHALAATKGALDNRFPRQGEYVTTFFKNVRPAPRRGASADKTPDAPPKG